MPNPTREELLRAATRSVTCRDDDVDALVPIVRQRVFGELDKRGWGEEHIQFRPTVQRGRRRKFVDENTLSASCGKNKFGSEQRFAFEMNRDLARAT